MQIFQNNELIANLCSKKEFELVFNDKTNNVVMAQTWTLKAKKSNFKEEIGIEVKFKKENIPQILSHFADDLKLKDSNSKILLIAENEEEKGILGNSQWYFEKIKE